MVLLPRTVLQEADVDHRLISVTTKVGPGLKDIAGTFQGQLKLLGVDYVDLLLIHWPYDFEKDGKPSNEDAWRAIEAIKDQGLAKYVFAPSQLVTRLMLLSFGRSIGVSNYRYV